MRSCKSVTCLAGSPPEVFGHTPFKLLFGFAEECDRAKVNTNWCRRVTEFQVERRFQ